MIATFFFSIVFGLIQFLLNLLPSIAFPQVIADGINTIIAFLKEFSFILPVNDMLAIAVLAAGLHLAVFTWKMVHWAYSWFRGHRIHK